jgi:hypothetical protein
VKDGYDQATATLPAAGFDAGRSQDTYLAPPPADQRASLEVAVSPTSDRLQLLVHRVAFFFAFVLRSFRFSLSEH